MFNCPQLYSRSIQEIAIGSWFLPLLQNTGEVTVYYISLNPFYNTPHSFRYCFFQNLAPRMRSSLFSKNNYHDVFWSGFQGSSEKILKAYHNNSADRVSMFIISFFSLGFKFKFLFYQCFMWKPF